ncbi:MAG: hypothetical protein HWQ23_08405 [Nostoc sp. JL33]|uniref:hypothetical protein n=1 Tax=Nostoc sp. JL33 TaxID=2815396 RepID=UPI0025FEC5C0|nr:hypothetical protein [Nostoc sp. JL33]MBN3870300.1 hypothetical protein [Nostoc sp. JL33]
MMCDVYDGKLRFSCYRCSQKLVELIRLPNSFGEYRRQCPSTENAGANNWDEIAQVSNKQPSGAVGTADKGVLRQERKAKGIVPF